MVSLITSYVKRSDMMSLRVGAWIGEEFKLNWIGATVLLDDAYMRLLWS
jgi:hypothetical protein